MSVASQTLLLQMSAAACYAIAGAFMKASEGMSNLRPTLAVYALFAVGVTLHTLSMRYTTMGTAYILVLGLEAVAALVISVGHFREAYGVREALGVILILAGGALVRGR